jgi:hypothetical protein
MAAECSAVPLQACTPMMPDVEGRINNPPQTASLLA